MKLSVLKGTNVFNDKESVKLCHQWPGYKLIFILHTHVRNKTNPHKVTKADRRGKKTRVSTSYNKCNILKKETEIFCTRHFFNTFFQKWCRGYRLFHRRVKLILKKLTRFLGFQEVTREQCKAMIQIYISPIQVLWCILFQTQERCLDWQSFSEH